MRLTRTNRGEYKVSLSIPFTTQDIKTFGWTNLKDILLHETKLDLVNALNSAEKVLRAKKGLKSKRSN